jgi:hypothetical protein
MDEVLVKGILEALGKMKPGESVVFPGRGGWEWEVTSCEGGGFDATHRNPAGDGRNKFYLYTTVDNKYGAGKTKQEPSLGVPCRNCGAEVDGAVVGALVRGVDGKISERFSWSNLVFAQKGTFSIGTDGALTVNDASKGFLQAVFLPDKNRLEGYVGVFGPTKPERVVVLEMEELLLATIDQIAA